MEVSVSESPSDNSETLLSQPDIWHVSISMAGDEYSTRSISSHSVGEGERPLEVSNEC